MTDETPRGFAEDLSERNDLLCPNNRTQRSGTRTRARNRLLSCRDPAFRPRMPLLRNSNVALGQVPRTGIRGWRMTLLRNSVATRSPLPFSRNATTGNSLECQSEVTRRHEFAESQRDGRCERANRQINYEGLRSVMPPL